MTINSTNRLAGPFIGAGTTATFPFTFKVFDQTDLDVVTLDVATGAIAVLALTADYTVALNPDQDTSPGGSITLVAAGQAGSVLTTGFTLTITTDMAALQGLELTNGGGFYPDVINSALDTLTILVQQLATQLGLALQAPLVDGSPNVVLPPAAERAGKLLMFDSNGDLSLIPIAPGSGVPGGQIASGAVDAANRNFTFIASAESTPIPMVFAGGVFQAPGTDYAIPVTQVGGATWQIAFTAAPAQGPIMVVLFG